MLKNKIDTIKTFYYKKAKPFLVQYLSVVQSGLFDYFYYLKNYGKNLTLFEKLFPIAHYMLKGWKLNYNPSEIFNGVEYQKSYPETAQTCPLTHFLRYGISHYYCIAQKNPYPINQKQIEKYLKQKQKRKSKKVIYTCITNNYDSLEEIACYKYVNKDWDYICFTDNETYINKKQIGIWKVRPLVFNELDNTRNNRYHKINPHIILPEYEESIYIDGNLNILSSYIFKEIKHRNLNLLLPKHLSNNCIFEEYKFAYREKIDKRSLIRKGWKIIKKSGMPRNYGKWECNLIYRKHNKPEIIEIMKEWWNFVKTYAKRDQLSFSYLMWENGIKIEDNSIPNTRTLIKDFYVFPHKKSYEKP